MSKEQLQFVKYVLERCPFGYEQHIQLGAVDLPTADEIVTAIRIVERMLVED